MRNILVSGFFIFSAGVSCAGELDGKNLFCNVNGRDTLFSFDGDYVLEAYVSAEQLVDDEYLFSYENIRKRIKKNKFSTSDAYIFWCDVVGIGPLDQYCVASSIEDLMYQVYSADSQLISGSWIAVDRVSLENAYGRVLGKEVEVVSSGSCRLGDSAEKDEYVKEMDNKVKLSKEEYKNMIEEAKKRAQKKKI